MVPLNTDSMRSWYVYIVKITQSYLYVDRARNGEAYRPAGSVEDVFHGRPVTKIRIHSHIFVDFKKAYGATHFDTPRLAALNMYDQSILSVELQPWSARARGFSQAEHWRSQFSSYVNSIAGLVSAAPVTHAFINGAQIVWCDRNDVSNRTIDNDKLAADPHFDLLPVQFINVQNLSARAGARLVEKRLRQAEAQQEEPVAMEIQSLGQGASLKVRQGYCLRYRPDPSEPDVFSLSPAFGAENATSFSATTSDREHLWYLFTLLTGESRTFINLEFVYRACLTIGKLYGYEKTDFFNVPAILADVGEVTLTRVAEASRKRFPVSLDAKSCLAYLLGLIHRETDVNTLRDLNRMMIRAVKGGFLSEDRFVSIYRENVTADDIPLLPLAG